MSLLESLLTSKKIKSTIYGTGYSEQFYGAAWSIFEKKSGMSHVTIDVQLDILRKSSQMKPHNSTGLISFSVIVSNFVNVLKENSWIGDLQSTSTLYLAVVKLHQVLSKKCWFYVDEKEEEWPDVIMFANRQSWSCMKGLQLSSESEEKQTKKAQIETNGSRNIELQC